MGERGDDGHYLSVIYGLGRGKGESTTFKNELSCLSESIFFQYICYSYPLFIKLLMKLSFIEHKIIKADKSFKVIKLENYIFHHTYTL